VSPSTPLFEKEGHFRYAIVDCSGSILPLFRKEGPGEICLLRYNPQLKGRARSLRLKPTDAEQRLCSSPPKADPRCPVLQAKANRQLHSRFLRTFSAHGCGGRRDAALRCSTSRSRQAPHGVFESIGITRAALHRPAGIAGAGFRSGRDIWGRKAEKSPLIPLWQRGRLLIPHIPLLVNFSEEEWPGEIDT
jgi:hypothetical protein